MDTERDRESHVKMSQGSLETPEAREYEEGFALEPTEFGPAHTSVLDP